MAPKKKPNTRPQKKSSPTPNFAARKIRNERIRLVAGFSLLALAGYLLFSFGSFLFNAEADQSKLDIEWFKLIKDSSINVDNITGKTGAWIADVFINRWFGLSSFLFIYLLANYGLRLLHRDVKKLLTKSIKTILLILWLSITLGYLFESKNGQMTIYPGGSYGYHISYWLCSLTGKIGTFFLLLISLLTYLTFAFEWFVNIFKRSPKEKNNPEGELFEENTSTPTENNIPKEIVRPNRPKETVKTQLIDLNDIEKDIKEPDTHEPVEVIDKEVMKVEETVVIEELETKVIAPDDKVNGLEMTVETKKEIIQEYENKPLVDYDPTLDLSNYHYPEIELLEEYSHLKSEVSEDELIENKNKIVETLRNFKIEIIKIKATIGPTVTLYEIVPAQGIRISKIKNLEDDIALSLSALGIRIIAPIPGRGTIGIEVPNRNPQVVSMRSIIASKKFQETTAELPIAMGRTISNETFVFDLTKMPHILVAGATGQGKSVGLNAIITSILFKKHPSQVKFIFIDPKKVELNLYSIIEKHFLAKLPDEEDPIITDVEKVKATLNSVGIEMDSRYDLLKAAHARNIKEYNKKFIERKLNPEKGHRFLPYIVVVVDEFADLIMTAGKEIELPIARIAQLARAVGIHMIIATQRPSANIITGIIKANFPSRIAFKVASMIDSRTILDQSGANQLIGKGDMLITSGSELIRLQCALVDTPEVERLCEHIASQQAYPTAYILPEYVGEEGDYPGAVDLKQRDELFDDAARIVVLNQQGSTSMIQRKFSIGYNRAGRIMDQLEAANIVGGSDGSKARKVFIQDEYSLEQLLNSI
jgi:S-DNA-T family DNA segregation ATPase FtsK/SpoIIIE